MTSPRHRLLRPIRRALPVLLAPVLAIGTLAAANAPAARSATHPSPDRPTAHRIPSPYRAASAQARATRHPVTITSLTTPTSLTTANPNGTFTVTEAAEPVRAWHDGAWAPLDPALRTNPGGKTVSPAVTSSPLALSGGGSGPLAVMTADARTLSLSWPSPLPTPTLSGATATYAGVVPGVDLVVTADDQGGFSEVLVVKNATAAASPALAALQLTISAPGLTVSANAAGNLAATISSSVPPIFTAQAPRVWDSAPLPAGTATVTGPDGTPVAAASGLPAASSAAAPGAGAHVATAGLTVSGNTLTLAPPASALTAPGTVYPVYIDPTWHNSASTNASAWTQVDSAWPTTSYWNESSDLQTGLCDWEPDCNGGFTARSFIRMPIPSQLTPGTAIESGGVTLTMTDQWAPSCTATAAELWTTGGIGGGTTWNNQPSWDTKLKTQSFAFGPSGCGYYKNDVTWSGSALDSTIKNDEGKSSQTFGIRASNESDDSQWKQYLSGGKNLILSVTYNYTPATPSGLFTSPNGTCGTSTNPVAIGDDDVSFSATVSDKDADALTTTFTIHNSADGSVPSGGTITYAGSSGTATTTVSRSVIQGWHSDGTTTQYSYYWTAQTTDQVNLTSGISSTCYFTYNPVAPAAPGVSVPGTASFGQAITATFTPPAGCATTSTCPVSYTYQLGPAAPATATVGTGSCTSSSCPVTITITQIGPIQFTVYSTAATGAVSDAYSTVITSSAPATAFADGDFNNDGKPDLLTTGTKGGLWLSTSNGSGTLTATTDIGGAGTGISPGADGPGDWTGTQVLHGNFTGQGVQDVMAYYPTGNSAGTAVIIGGSGGAPLQPYTNPSNLALFSTTFQDPVSGDPPTTLAAAGNASQTGAAVADLIGAANDGNGYELDLFTSTPGGGPDQYGLAPVTVLAAQSPGQAAGAAGDWNNYSLATAQPGGNPSDTVLFALNNTTGALYESINPGCPSACSTTTLIGMPGTWAQLTTPWGSGTAPGQLASADINAASSAELWLASGTTANSYIVNGASLALEAASTLSQPAAEWPLADGNGTSATETITGNNATLNGSGATWANDTYFSNVASFDGASAYLLPSAATIPTTDTTPSLSLWFKTTHADGVLASLQTQAVSTGPTTSTGYNPVLYIGTDGKLYGEWYNGSAGSAIPSNTPVDDGLWHHAVITGNGSTQTLYLDGASQAHLSGSIDLTNTSPTNLTFGAGYIGGHWPSEKYSNQTGTLDYFNGQIADATFTTGQTPAGIWAATNYGNIYNKGPSIPWYGSHTGLSNGAAFAATPDGKGYWLITASGTVYPFGDAASVNNWNPNCSVIAAATDPAGGFWALTNCGNVYQKGGAAGYGSHTGITNATGLASTPDGKGYWVVTSNATVYNFGDAAAVASWNAPCSGSGGITGATGDPNGGFWAYTACGNIDNKAGAPWYGSQAGNITNGAALAVTPDGNGYWLITATGTVYAYGDAPAIAAWSPAHTIVAAVSDPTMTTP